MEHVDQESNFPDNCIPHRISSSLAISTASEPEVNHIRNYLIKEFSKKGVKLNFDHSLNEKEVVNYLSLLKKIPKPNIFARLRQRFKNQS